MSGFEESLLFNGAPYDKSGLLVGEPYKESGGLYEGSDFIDVFKLSNPKGGMKLKGIGLSPYWGFEVLIFVFCICIC